MKKRELSGNSRTSNLAGRCGLAACEPLEHRQLLAVDLIAGSVSADPQTVAPGEEVDVALSFQNGGDEPAGAFRLQAFLSKDNVIGNGDDIPIGSFRRSAGLGAGGTVTTTRSLVIPDGLRPDSYFVGFRLDGTGAIPEINEDNNTQLSSDAAVTIVEADAAYEILGRDDEVIADGDDSPSRDDGTRFRSADVDGETRERTFTIVNLGDGDLNISDIAITGAAAGDFELIDEPGGPIGPGGEATFTIRFDPSAEGLRTATVMVTPGSAGDDAYIFDISGRGRDRPDVPDIRVVGNAEISDGDRFPGGNDGTFFGRVRLNQTAEQTFTIFNNGDGVLELTSPFITISGRNASHFTIIQQPDDTSLEPGESTTFVVRFDPGRPGEKRAVISILSDDPNEGTFDFLIRGIGGPRGRGGG